MNILYGVIFALLGLSWGAPPRKRSLSRGQKIIWSKEPVLRSTFSHPKISRPWFPQLISEPLDFDYEEIPSVQRALSLLAPAAENVQDRGNVEEEGSAVQPPLKKKELSRDSVTRLLLNKAALKHREQPIAHDEGQVKQLKPVARLVEAPVQEADPANRDEEKLVVEDSRDIIQLGDVKELPSGVKADEDKSRVFDEYIDVMSRLIEDTEPVEQIVSSKAETAKDNLVPRPEDHDVRDAGQVFKKVAPVAVSEVIVTMTGEKEKGHPEPLESADSLKATEVKMDGGNVVLEKSDSLLYKGDSVVQIQISLKKPGTVSVPLTLTAERSVIELAKRKDQPSHADQTKLERPASSVQPEAPSTKPKDVVSKLEKEKTSIGDVTVTAENKISEPIESAVMKKAYEKPMKDKTTAGDTIVHAEKNIEPVNAKQAAKKTPETTATKPLQIPSKEVSLDKQSSLKIEPTEEPVRTGEPQSASKERIKIAVEAELPVKKDQTSDKKQQVETESQEETRKEQGKAERPAKDGHGQAQAPAAKIESPPKDDKVTAPEKPRPAMDLSFLKEGIRITVNVPSSELELPVKKDQTADKKHRQETESQDKTRKEQGKAEGPAVDGDVQAPAVKLESSAKDDKVTAAEKPQPAMDHDFRKEGITIVVTAPRTEPELPVKKDQNADKKHRQEIESQDKTNKEQGKVEGPAKDWNGQTQAEAPAATLESSAKDDKVTPAEKPRPAMDHDFRKEGIMITVTAPRSELELPAKKDQTADKKHGQEIESQDKTRKEQEQAEGLAVDGDGRAPAAKLESSAKDDKLTPAEKPRPAMDHDFRKEGITIPVTVPRTELEMPVKKDQTADKNHGQEIESQDKTRKEQGKAEGPAVDGDVQAPAVKLESSAKDDKVTSAEKPRPAMDHDFRKEGITITVTAPRSELELPVKKDQTADKKHRQETESQDKTRKEQGKAEGPAVDGDGQAPTAKLESSAKDDKVTAAEKPRPAMDHDFRKEGITITVTAPGTELELPVKKDQTADKQPREETESQDKTRKEQGKAEGTAKDGDEQALAAKQQSSAKDDKVTAAEKPRPAIDHDFRKEGITITITAPRSEPKLPAKKDQTADKKHREEIESQEKVSNEQGKAGGPAKDGDGHAQAPAAKLGSSAKDDKVTRLEKPKPEMDLDVHTEKVQVKAPAPSSDMDHSFKKHQEKAREKDEHAKGPAKDGDTKAETPAATAPQTSPSAAIADGAKEHVPQTFSVEVTNGKVVISRPVKDQDGQAQASETEKEPQVEQPYQIESLAATMNDGRKDHVPQKASIEVAGGKVTINVESDSVMSRKIQKKDKADGRQGTEHEHQADKHVDQEPAQDPPALAKEPSSEVLQSTETADEGLPMPSRGEVGPAPGVTHIDMRVKEDALQRMPEAKEAEKLDHEEAENEPVSGAKSLPTKVKDQSAQAQKEEHGKPAKETEKIHEELKEQAERRGDQVAKVSFRILEKDLPAVDKRRETTPAGIVEPVQTLHEKGSPSDKTVELEGGEHKQDQSQKKGVEVHIISDHPKFVGKETTEPHTNNEEIQQASGEGQSPTTSSTGHQKEVGMETAKPHEFRTEVQEGKMAAITVGKGESGELKVSVDVKEEDKVLLGDKKEEQPKLQEEAVQTSTKEEPMKVAETEEHGMILPVFGKGDEPKPSVKVEGLPKKNTQEDRKDTLAKLQEAVSLIEPKKTGETPTELRPSPMKDTLSLVDELQNISDNVISAVKTIVSAAGEVDHEPTEPEKAGTKPGALVDAEAVIPVAEQAKPAEETQQEMIPPSAMPGSQADLIRPPMEITIDIHGPSRLHVSLEELDHTGRGPASNDDSQKVVQNGGAKQSENREKSKAAEPELREKPMDMQSKDEVAKKIILETKAEPDRDGEAKPKIIRIHNQQAEFVPAKVKDEKPLLRFNQLSQKHIGAVKDLILRKKLERMGLNPDPSHPAESSPVEEERSAPAAPSKRRFQFPSRPRP